MESPRKVDTVALICDDLGRCQRAKRRHFLPAFALVLILLAGALVVAGVRPDLLEQSGWALAVQLVLWGVCLVAFPAIGVGLWFPRRGVRAAMALIAVTSASVAVTGWPLVDPAWGPSSVTPSGCLTMIVTVGVLLMGLGWTSGAFVERRSPTAAFWLLSAVVLMGLDLVTWHCPHTGLAHLVPAHVGGAAILLAVGGTLAWLLRRPAVSSDRS